MEGKFVSFGDCLLLSSEEPSGFLSSAGFTDPDCYVQEASDEDLVLLANKRHMIFQILPKLSYENQRELDKYREEKFQQNSAYRSQMHEEEKQILLNLELRSKAEEDLNEKTILQRAGEYLTYGQEIQLRHMSSGMLLTVSKDKAKGDKSCLMISLTFDGGSGVCFKIASRFKFRQEGDKVMYGDNVLFLSMKEVGNYLHVTNKLIDIDSGQGRITKLDLRPPASTFAKRFEANSSSLKTSWRLTPYSIISISQRDKNLLKGGELIRLKHTETEGYLACEGYDFTKDGMAEVYVRQYKGEDDLERYSAMTLFIVEKDSSDIEGMPCVWTSNDRSSIYRIRHFVTGRSLCVVNAAQDNTVSLSKHPHESKDEPVSEIRESTLFGMVSTSIEMDNFIRDGSIIQLKFMPDNSFLEPTSEEWKFEQEEAMAKDSIVTDFEDLNGAIYEPLQEEDLAVARYKVALTKSVSEVDSFFISKANVEEVQEIEFILSTIPVLTNFVSSFMKGNEPYKYLYEAVKEAISQFIIFLNESEEMDPLKREGIPIKRRQKFVRELGVIDLICNLLHWPFYSGIHDLSSQNSNSLMSYIVKLGYKFIKQAAKDYRMNETYCSQWIGLFLQHAQKASNPDDSNAEEILTEIISDNKWIVEKQIKPRMIEKFISLCRDNVRHEKYMNLLSSLCVCNEQAVTRNQTIISELLLKDLIFREVLLMPLRMSPTGEVEIEVKEYNRWINLTKLYAESVNEDDGRIFNYFLSLMDLVSVLAYDRNYQSQDLNEVYPFDITYRIVTDSKIRDDIRARFVRVMLNLHINQGEIHILNVPNYIRVWKEIDLENSITIQYSKIPLSPGFKHLKLFVLEYLTSVKGVLRSADAEKNLLIKEILKVTQFMVNCGFYQSIEELSSVLDPMIPILDGTTDIIGLEYAQIANRSPTRSNTMSKLMLVIQRKSGIQQERYNIREDSLIITECKKIICQIFIKVQDLRIDYMMSQYLQMFRKSWEMVDIEPPELRIPNPLKAKSLNEGTLNVGLFDFKNSKLKAKYKVPSELKAAVKWINEILADHSLDLQASSSKLLCILIDLCLYKDLSLVVEGFSMMLMQFSSRIRFLNSLNDLQMLEQDQAVENLFLVKKNLKELKHYSERAENWLGKHSNSIRPSTSQVISSPQDLKSKEAHDQVSDILLYLIDFTHEVEKNPDLQFDIEEDEDYSIIHNFSNNLMSSKNTLDSVPQNYMTYVKDMFIHGENPNMKEPTIYNANEKSLTENQRLLRNLKVYEPVLELVKHKGISITSYSKEKHFYILRLCYIFLCKFCRNNNENKLILYSSIDAFLDDADKNIFATNLIREIFRNNYSLTAQVPINLLRGMVRSIDSVPISDKKCEMLKTLTIFMYVNSKILKDNQTEVLNQLASSERKNVIMLFAQPNEQERLKMIVNSIVSKYEVGAGEEICVDLPDDLIYALSLIDVMTMSAWDKSGQAELICQSLIPLRLFESLFHTSGKLWPLKKSLILFFLHVYLDIEFTMNEDEVVMWKCVEVIRNDLIWIYKNCVHTDKLITTTQNILYRSSDGIIPMSEYANNYIYEGIFPCLQEIFLKRARTLPNESIPVLKEVALYSIYFYKLAYNDTYKNLSTELIQNMVKVDILHRIVEDQGLPFTSEDVYQMKYKKSSAVKYKLTYKISSEFGVVKSFKGIIRGLLKEDIIKDAIEIEFEEMVRAMNDITKNSTEAFGEAFVVDFHHLIKSFIALLGPDCELDSSIKVMGFKILRKIVEIENKNMVVPASEWDTKEWIEFEKMIVYKQELLCELGVVDLVWNIVIQTEEQDIIYECVLLCIALLLGGNLKVQNTFLKRFRIDKGNEFLLKIKRILLQNFEVIRKKQTFIIEAAERKYKETHTKFDGQFTNDSDSSSDEIMDSDIDQSDPNSPIASNPKSFDLLVNLLRFIQLLCEGHHDDFQNYLREQSQDGVVNIKNFNFINAISGMLGPYIKFLSADNLRLGYQILDTLTEVVQGPCRENQRVLSHAKIIDNGRDLLAGLRSDADRDIRGFNDDNLEMIGELKSKAVNFLLSLLEGDADQEILLRITESLDYKEIKRRMWEVYESFVTENLDVDPVTASLNSINSKLTKDCFEGAVAEGFNLLILINKLADDYPPAQRYVKETTFEENEYKAYSFFKMHTGRIEVIKDEVLTRLYFPIQPVCKHVSEISKEDLMLSVNRDSPSNKVSDLLSRASDLIDEMKHNEMLSRAKLKITSERIGSLRDTSLLLVILANYLILFNTDYSEDDYKGVVPDDIDLALYAIVVFVLALNGLVLIGWFFLRGQLIINKGWRKLVESSPYHKMMKDTIFDKHVSEMTVQETYRILMAKGPTAPEFYQNETRNFGHLSTKLTYYSVSLGMIMIDSNFRYFLIYIALAALGFINYIFLSILLLDVVYRNRVLRNVLNAVVTNRKQLLMTAVLGFVIIYIYAFWGFLIDRDMYYDSSIGSAGENQCQSLWQCFLFTLNYGFRSGGGVGDVLQKVSFTDNTNLYYGRFLYDLSFFVIVVIIILNVIFGIIIDTFAQLRDKKSFIEEDMNTKCFICSQERSLFDRYSYGFEKHQLEDHNVWQYIYFLIHLQVKDSTEFNGTESYCADMIKKEDISWIPLHRAMCLDMVFKKKEQEEEVSKQVKSKVAQLEEDISELIKVVKLVSST